MALITRICFISLFITAPVGALMMRANQGPVIHKDIPKDMPNIDVYVINMDERPDRCKCMQKMLEEGHHRAAYRHKANADGACVKHFFSDGKRNSSAEQGLFCSNREVWERSAKSDADFIMVLEDDLVIKDKVKFWSEVHKITSCGSWKYLSVDMFGNYHTDEFGKQKFGSPTGREQNEACGAKSNLFQLARGSFGAHMQLIKKSFLQEMIQMADIVNGAEQYDHYIWNFNTMGGFRWQPDIVTQFTQSGKIEGQQNVDQQYHKEMGCDASVDNSDLELVKSSSGLEC